MKLYNSLSRKREKIEPHEPGVIRMYTCGPTVYHYAHIGNLRSYIMEDVLERQLKFNGYDVKRVMNITDVGHLASDADTGEDKMLAGARREQKSVLEIAKYYTDAFFEDCEKLNIIRPEIVENATDCIDTYIEIIEGLIEKGYAYFEGGNVYFDTSKLDKYFVFQDIEAEDLDVGVREGVVEDPNKKNPNDFVLWFTKSKFEDQALKWDSPWGVGYPGWHIECSGISLKHLGEYLDIHCGGVDNMFPHHTNEIAQSESYLGHKWCKYWMHIHHLNTNDGKMSKSSGELLTVSQLTEKGYDPLAYRFFCLQSHYRKNLVFSYENLDNAVQAYDKLIKRIARLEGEPKLHKESEEKAERLMDGFMDAMNSDLNTALAMSSLYDVLKEDIHDESKLYLLNEFDKVLGLDLLAKADEERQKADTQEDNPEVEALIAERAEAKKNRNWALADKIRDELKAKGIILKDTPEGTTWEYE